MAARQGSAATLKVFGMTTLNHLEALEAEAIHILRDGVSAAKNPVLLFSAGKDSTVLAHLALKAFYPSVPPLELLHVDSTWEYPELCEFRDNFAKKHGFRLKVFANEEGRAQGLNPIDHGDTYTRIMRTEALKKALDDGKYDVIFGGARRDEEKSRAKERIVSVRSANHGWDPKNQRPELWSIYNWTLAPGQTLRAFPLSNWTEQDIWSYIIKEDLELAPLYYAKKRPVIDLDGMDIYIAENKRLESLNGYDVTEKSVRFRTLGCWPVTAAADSEAATAKDILKETLLDKGSERRGRVSDSGSLETEKRNGYF